MSLVPDAPRPRRGERDEVGDRSRTALLREPDQHQQNLRGRLRVGQRAMTRPHVRSDEVRELRERRTRHAPREQAAREADGVDDRRRDPRPRQPLGLPVEEREIEARVVRDEHRVAGECEEAPQRDLHGRRASKLPVGEAGERRHRGPERPRRIDERLELRLDLELPDPHRSDLADLRAARPEPRRLEVDDDVRRRLEREAFARRSRERDRVAAPGQPRVRVHDLREQRAGEPRRGPPEREQPARGLLCGHGPTPLLHELDQPVGRVQAKLHRH